MRRGDLVDQALVGLRDLDLQLRLAGLLGQLALRAAQLLDRGMRDVERVEDLGLGHLVGAAFDHQHGLVGTGHDEIHVGGEQLLLRRVDDEVALDLADPHRADRRSGTGCRRSSARRTRRSSRGCRTVWTWSTDSVRLTSCVSRRQPFGKSGRSGRSIMRAISVAFSPARPSRLKNEPGILPAAYMRSSTSTVSGRKSTSRRLPAVAVDSTTVSPAVTVTAPGGLLGHLARLEGDLGTADFDGNPVHFRHMSLSCRPPRCRQGPSASSGRFGNR